MFEMIIKTDLSMSQLHPTPPTLPPLLPPPPDPSKAACWLQECEEELAIEDPRHTNSDSFLV